MAYDNDLAEKIRKAIDGQPGWTERKMFGGVAFLLRGNMCAGIVKDLLMVRVGTEEHDKALARPHVRPMDFAGRPMRGFVYVEPAGTKTVSQIAKWIELAVAAPKPVKKKKASRAAGATRRK
jgi:TfoX/Sxy family transcriptional regulator of competence genes